MATLEKLIKRYGEPDALIDHWDNQSNRFAIWGFERIYCKNIADLDVDNPLSEWQKTIDCWKEETKPGEVCAIGGFSYDLKSLLYPNLSFKNYESNLPVIWFGKPKVIHSYNLSNNILDDATALLKMKNDIPSKRIYEKNINKIKKFLEKGDIYQINYTNPKFYDININPFELYLFMRNIAKPDCGFYLNTKKFQILSVSPERFFKSHDSIIKTFPIKGTRKRNKNLILDQLAKEELSNSIKDRAEHLMIVDLLRNDLGRICDYGSVKTKDLYKIESFETVHHMVTEISGKLKNNINESSIINALFPGGSITGAPKERAMEIIDLIENYNRKFYTGSFGYITSDNKIDMNIAIRSMTVLNNKGEYPVGGGIVWDSNPTQEWNEAQSKSIIIDKTIKKYTKKHV